MDKISIVFSELHWDLATLSYGTINGEWYFGVLVDRASHVGRLVLHKSKADNFQGFKHLYLQLKASKPHLKCMHVVTDNESNTLEFQELAKQERFPLRLGSPHTGKAWLAERCIQIFRRAAKAQLLEAKRGPRYAGHALRNSEVILNNSYSSALPLGITRNQAWEIEDLSNDARVIECRKKGPKLGEYHRFGEFCVVKTFAARKDDANGVYARYLGLLHSAPGLFVVELVDTRRIVVTKNVEFLSKSQETLTNDFLQLYFAETQNLSEECPPDADGGTPSTLPAVQPDPSIEPWKPCFSPLFFFFFFFFSK